MQNMQVDAKYATEPKICRKYAFYASAYFAQLYLLSGQSRACPACRSRLASCGSFPRGFLSLLAFLHTWPETGCLFFIRSCARPPRLSTAPQLPPPMSLTTDRPPGDNDTSGPGSFTGRPRPPGDRRRFAYSFELRTERPKRRKVDGRRTGGRRRS